jgi:CubicO group peptidase (beta-lactamase class C family)
MGVMRASPSGLTAVTILALLGALRSQSCHDLNGVDLIANDLLQQAPVFGSSCVLVKQHGVTQLERCYGNYTMSQVVPIASATKTLSGAVLMSLVDDGIVSLDDLVAQYLPEWGVGEKAQITLRMCFAHTAGISGHSSVISDNTITLRQAAQLIALSPLQSTPGTTFAYAGGSMHVAGAVCEVASGQSWAQLFVQRIAQPLGMTATDFGAFGPTSNPRIAGGARSNLRDFSALMEMLRANGLFGGVQVLSQQAVNTLLSDQTAGTVIASTPHPYAAPYGIGIWLDGQDSQGRTLFASGVGAFGFAGWVDRARDVSGVFLVRYVNEQTYPYLERIWQEVGDALLPAGVACVGISTPTCAHDVWLNGNGAATAGNLDFAVVVARAPANALGGMVLGEPAPGGLGVLDMTAFIGPPFVTVATLLSDADGRAAVSAPLASGLLGLTVGVQSFWLGDNACAATGLQASHALQLTVLP